MAGKAVGVIEASDPDAAIAEARRLGVKAFRADPDNPARLRLSTLLQTSHLSNREFARRVLGRDVRSLARYLGGDIMPPELADQLLRMSVQVTEQSITVKVRR